MIKKLLACFSLFMLVMAVILGIVLWQGYRFWLATPVEGAAPVSIEIPEGSSLTSIAENLETNGIIAKASWFEIYAKSTGLSRNLQAGIYELQPGMNYQSVLMALTVGESEEIQITIPEGYTLDQIGEVVTTNFEITQESFDYIVGGDSPLEQHPFVLAAQKPDDASLEGYLFPDTYRFFPDATPEEIVGRMIDEMSEKVGGLNAELGIRAGGPETIHEFLTLASIIEREVRGAEDMKIVSGIFYNRLAINMALQADSTVNYVTGKDTPGISLEDTDLDSPYNTYKYPGLPPASISNPGLNALTATADPTDNGYFFFLTTLDTGEVIYATTHDEHVANKNAHLR